MSIKTRVLIISDTHCAALTTEGHKRLHNEAFRLPLPKADMLIHCGDLTMTGELDEYHRALDMLKQIDAPVKLVIAGNHDLSLDEEFVVSHAEHDRQTRQPSHMTEKQARQRVQRAKELWSGSQSRAYAEGITYLEEGVHRIELANGTSINLYASAYTPEFYDWAFAYERHQDRFNSQQESMSDAQNIAVNAIPSKEDTSLDIVITHGPAWLRLDPTTRGDPAGCPHLLRALMRARPLIHCFGHIHEGWGAERVVWSSDTELGVSSTSIAQFKDKSWQDGVVSVSRIYVDQQDLSSQHAACIDISQHSQAPIRKGRETMFVNAAIMDVSYKPANAPWLIDIDLPSAGSTEIS